VWGAGVFAVHAIVATALVRIRDLSLGSSTWWTLGSILRVSEFWVYRWVLPWFNDLRFATPMYKLNELFGVSTMRASSEFYESLMLSVFGGVVYVAVVVVWVKRARKVRHAVVQPASA
jgi:hypothetical protein